MMQISTILIVLYLRVSQSLTVSINVCSCSAILTAYDCNQLSTCEWDLSSKSCNQVRLVAYSSTLCSSIIDGGKCAKQRGCAFVDKKCVVFSNCQSYIATSNVECQKYSMLCNWSLVNQYCTDESVCNEYVGEDKQSGCESVKQLNGEGLCLYNTSTKQCKEKECKDYPKKTNEDCNKVLLNQLCISDKKTCVKELANCDSYNVEDCLYILSKDGECEVNNNTNKCQLRTCKLAPDASSDEACKKYKSTCLSNKQKCVDSLGSCSAYTIDECLSYKGINGDCQINSDIQQCKDPSCEDFKGTTIDECKKASPNLKCISNGIQCVSILAGTCKQVKILENSTCDQYISLEGQCKPETEGSKVCVLDICSNHDLDTDELCNKYSSRDTNSPKLCISNGVKCTTSLQPCSSYKKSDGCFKYKGSDGKCFENEVSDQCQPTPCEIIQQPSLTTCISTNPSCQFDGQNCVTSLKQCNQYTSKCETIISINNKPCIQDPTDPEKCIEQTCNTAPLTTKTDEDCQAYFPTCLTNGQGCTDKLENCDTYTGTFQQCEKLIGLDGKCTGTSKTQTTDKCIAKTCQESSTANEQACKAYTKNCLFNGIMKKCQPSIQSCKSIDNQMACEQTLTTAPGRFCLWVNEICVTATCNMIETQGSQDVCNIFGDSCQYDNLGGCKDSTFYECSSLRSRTTCTTDQSGNACIWDNYQKKCIKFNKCEDFVLRVKRDGTGNTIPKDAFDIFQDNFICSSISDKCFSDGSETCKHKLPCQKFTQENCNQSVGINEKICGYNAIQQVCQTFGACGDLQLKTHVECQAYSSQCTTNKETCVEKVQCTLNKDQDSCEAGGTDGRCFWENSACSPWKCQNALLTTHQDCQKQSPKCTTNGTNCIDLMECDKYESPGCVIAFDNTACFYDAQLSKCRLKVCSDYTGITEQQMCQNIGCAYDSANQACISFDSCNNYKSQFQCNDNVSKDNSTCIWQEQINSTSNCLQMDSCSQANSIEKNCKNFGCAFVPEAIINGTVQNSQCNQMDCSLLNPNSNSDIGCKPLINTISKQITLCAWSTKTNKCVESTDLSSYNQNTCFTLTQYNYYWNPSTSQCVSCTKIEKPQNSTKANDTPNETTQNSFGIGLIQQLTLLMFICFQLF
ncbi:unnamed protein product [Paramecium octaurelia]|uniref:Uncharacterized protein n=1 Tax=Paramecium octaurelia TaxID=43137 RepID=A0A8S1RXG3_PAROT|nr:unnamed protein product [Paramecium octaurelia]